MARFGLPHWLRGERPQDARKRRQELRRRLRFLRPRVEPLEDRNAPGSMLSYAALLAAAALPPRTAAGATLDRPQGLPPSPTAQPADTSTLRIGPPARPARPWWADGGGAPPAP